MSSLENKNNNPQDVKKRRGRPKKYDNPAEKNREYMKKYRSETKVKNLEMLKLINAIKTMFPDVLQNVITKENINRTLIFNND